MLLRTLRLCIVVALVVSCTDEPRSVRTGVAAGTPYGVWVWDEKYVAVLTRSDTYSFCDEFKCVTGQVDVSNPHYVWLVNFYKDPLAEKFGLDAYLSKPAFDAYRSAVATSRHPEDLDFTPGRVQAESSTVRCAKQPCVILGHLEKGAVFRQIVAF